MTDNVIDEIVEGFMISLQKEVHISGEKLIWLLPEQSAPNIIIIPTINIFDIVEIRIDKASIMHNNQISLIIAYLNNARYYRYIQIPDIVRPAIATLNDEQKNNLNIKLFHSAIRYLFRPKENDFQKEILERIDSIEDKLQALVYAPESSLFKTIQAERDIWINKSK